MSSNNGTPSEFSFYIKFAKPLIFHLLEPKDRVLAAAWLIRILEEDEENNTDNDKEELRTTVLKYLLLTLQKRKLWGPFKQHPDRFPELKDFLQAVSARISSPSSSSELTAKNGFLYDTDVSSDFCQYVAYQDVEDFGIHCFYATSQEPIHLWDNFRKSCLPEGPKPERGWCKCTYDECNEEIEDDTEKCKKKKKGKSKCVMNQPRTTPLLGKEVAVDEDRMPAPTWGSNLIKAQELCYPFEII